jgi:hypothetical protein
MGAREIDPAVLDRLLGRLKAHLRVTASDLDGELRGKLRAAIGVAEHRIGRVIPLTEVTDTLPFSQTLTLSRPLVSVDGVKVDGVAVEGWEADTFTGTVTLPEGTGGASVTVTYTAGMPQIPDDIVSAILLVASSLFSNPMDSVETLPKASARLLRPYRNYGL